MRFASRLFVSVAAAAVLVPAAFAQTPPGLRGPTTQRTVAATS